MISRERVLAALRREEPDRVPYCEIGVDRVLAGALLGWSEPQSEARDLEENDFSVEETKAVAGVLGMDNITYVLRAPVYAEKIAGKHGRLFYGRGLIEGMDDLGMIDLPDPRSDALYLEAEEFVRGKSDYAVFFITRMGVFPALLSMGIERMSIALFEDPGFVEAVLDRYFAWATVVAERACSMGFDVLVTTDDMAFKTAPYFSPEVFRRFFLPRYRKAAEKISIPWIVHSDGNLMPYMDDLLSLPVAGFHPNERGAMDIRETKRRHGDRICVLGNVDLNTLSEGTPADVDAEIRGLIRDVAPGGGYILTSGNSLAAYVKPENALAMGRAVRAYGRYPIGLRP